MVQRSMSSSNLVCLDKTAIDLEGRGPNSRFRGKSSASTPELRPSDSSIFEFAAPFSQAMSLVRRVFTETFLLLRLAVRLWTYLGVGWKWSIQLARLVLYATLLLPGFLQMIGFYVCSPRVRRSVVYGPKPRQRLDLYFPPNAHLHAGYPVVIYVTGGAWTIGYKAWGALLARRLSKQGVLVACLDYRNFPQGDALDMLEDVNTGIAWVLSRIHRYGGDPDSITLVGQSAGGHLAGLALIKQAEQAALGTPTVGASPAWSPSSLRAFVGVSGAYDLRGLAEHLHRRGLYKNVFERIMSLSTTDGCNGSGGYVNGNGYSVEQQNDKCELSCENDCVVSPQAHNSECNNAFDRSRSDDGVCVVTNRVPAVGTSHDASGCKGGALPAYEILSPLEAVRRLPPGAASQLPYVFLIHGTADKTVPADGSAALSEALQSCGAPRVRCLLIPGKTHTSFLLEDPMRGGRDLLMDSVLGTVTGAGEAEVHVYRTLCPGLLCDLAGWVCPF